MGVTPTDLKGGHKKLTWLPEDSDYPLRQESDSAKSYQQKGSVLVARSPLVSPPLALKHSVLIASPIIMTQSLQSIEEFATSRKVPLKEAHTIVSRLQVSSNEAKLDALAIVTVLLSLKREKAFYRTHRRFVNALLSEFRKGGIKVGTMDAGTRLRLSGSDMAFRWSTNTFMTSGSHSLPQLFLTTRGLIVHELYHFYQKLKNKRGISWAAAESGAYIVSGEYLIATAGLKPKSGERDQFIDKLVAKDSKLHNRKTDPHAPFYIGIRIAFDVLVKDRKAEKKHRREMDDAVVFRSYLKGFIRSFVKVTLERVKGEVSAALRLGDDRNFQLKSAAASLNKEKIFGELRDYLRQGSSKRLSRRKIQELSSEYCHYAIVNLWRKKFSAPLRTAIARRQGNIGGISYISEVEVKRALAPLIALQPTRHIYFD